MTHFRALCGMDAVVNNVSDEWNIRPRYKTSGTLILYHMFLPFPSVSVFSEKLRKSKNIQEKRLTTLTRLGYILYDRICIFGHSVHYGGQNGKGV
jgi:hypothetical protein